MIGQAHRFQHKTHPMHKRSRRQHALSLQRRMPGNSGFLYLQADALYLAGQNRLVITVSSKRRPENLGPALYIKRYVEDWHRDRNEDGSIPQALHDALEDVAKQVMQRQLPETDLFLEKCNTSGEAVEVFLEEVCTKCRCWYCDLAS